MAKCYILTPKDLRKLLRYDADTGKLFWRERSQKWFNECAQGKATRCAMWNGRYAGKEAFTTEDGSKYLIGGILGRQYLAHRVIWALDTGSWPDNEIDHINHNRSDNRICNLREVTSRENKQNVGLRADSRSGATGVCWHKQRGKWQAYIKAENKRVHLGLFSKFEDAVIARSKANAKYGFHKNHGT